MHYLVTRTTQQILEADSKEEAIASVKGPWWRTLTVRCLQRSTTQQTIQPLDQDGRTDGAAHPF